MSDLPQKYRQSNDNLVFNVDYVDFLSNAMYKRFYACGGEDSTGNIYFLTQNASQEASQNNRTISSTNDTQTKNFDILIRNPVTIAPADCFFNASMVINSAASFIVTIYHVSASGTATSLGAKTSPSRSGGVNTYRESMKITLTEKSFSVGDTLRVTIALTDTDANATNLYIDPASLATLTESGSGRTIGTDCTIDIPFLIS